MKALDKRATHIFLTLVQGLDRTGRTRKVDNAPGTFMSVNVERLSSDPEVFSIAHYFTSHGDLVPDPDVEFIVTRTNAGGKETVGVYPSAIDQGPLGYRRYAEPLPGGRARPVTRGQDSLVNFCNSWMANIWEQQRLAGREIASLDSDDD